ncbi:MAG: DNA polymerase III subunit beta [Parcubacteria group bacterium]|jgi:DNA polymerase-3 subunit beta|nr:DNA polymerase III subunit beta [Parcubacteria group bacterium]|tara:strand:+ start:9511 stop:10656 length:1146 start_codon:yes stop_codon:yes gene_type:complete
MHLFCLQKNLKQVLNITGRIIGRNLTLPILNNLLLSVENNKLKISSTNLEIGINSWVSGKIQKQGSITVPAKLISDFVNNLPNEKIELKTKAQQLEIKCKKFKAILKGLSADDFPIIPKIKDQSPIIIKGSILKNSFSQVVEMASVSESRPEISGIYMKLNSSNSAAGKNTIKLAATDSFRLAEKNIEINSKSLNKEYSVIIPQRTIQEIIRILGEKESSTDEYEQEVKIILSGSQILFNFNDTQVISRLIEGQYPDYQQIIPSNLQTQVIINKQELISNIKIASLFSGKINDIKMSVNPKKSLVEILSKDADIGENKSKIEAKIQGKEIETFFNHRYLLDGLNNIFSDKVMIGLNDTAKPVVIRPVGDTSYTYVVMPIKV